MLLTVIISKMKTIPSFRQKHPFQFMQLVRSVWELLIYVIGAFLVWLQLPLLCS